MNYKLIGEQIRKYRKRLGLTQQQLGKGIGVSREMVSRYERGASSPMGKIDKIATSLKVTPIDLLTDGESAAREVSTASQVPLFTTMPRGFDFTKKVGYYYSAPEWITKVDAEAFAVDPSIVEVKSVQVSGNGPLYISPTSKPAYGDLILFKDSNRLLLDKYDKDIAKGAIIGVVLAQERRFVE